MNEYLMHQVTDRDTLFERLGGAHVLETIIKEFYRRVLSDRSLSKSFEDIDIEWIKQRQIDVFIDATGGPRSNTVQRTRSVFIQLPVGRYNFPKMRIHLIETLLHLSIAFPLIDEVVRLLRPINYSSQHTLSGYGGGALRKAE